MVGIQYENDMGMRKVKPFHKSAKNQAWKSMQKILLLHRDAINKGEKNLVKFAKTAHKLYCSSSSASVFAEEHENLRQSRQGYCHTGLGIFFRFFSQRMLFILDHISQLWCVMRTICILLLKRSLWCTILNLHSSKLHSGHVFSPISQAVVGVKKGS